MKPSVDILYQKIRSFALHFVVIFKGDIEFLSMDDSTGVVSVRLKGACAGCPGAAMTLKMGVERHLKEKVPQVTEVVASQ